MNKFYGSLFVSATTFLAAQSVFAAQFESPSNNSLVDLRCENDVLSVEGARTRLNWSKENKIIPVRTIMKWLYTTEVNEETGETKSVLDPLPYYPVFGVWDATARVVVGSFWKPEANAFPKTVTAPNTWIGSCRSGCFTPYQQILTGSGYQAIIKAYETNNTEIVTLDESSTFEGLKFKNSKVGRYVISAQPTNHDVLTFKTVSGGHIQVTDNHPLVTGDGIVRESRDIKVGDSLFTAQGSADQITEIVPEKFYGQVYNVEPESEKILENVMVAQGFLSGSARYQKSYAKYYGRELFSGTINADLLPQ